ncbi:MAG: NUDIX domain-containing protein [Hamadaea sp.]|nr:NUDIX domain-containing protein [Hamadaea sp.]NUT18435.1 NUDIX domain-containing protein [Hamadaea sp.]
MPTPEFILALREKIGHDLLWMPGVTAVVLNADRQILLVRRKDNGRWTLVTGCLDPGEQPAIGALREVWEETGVTAVAVRLLRVQALPPSTYPNGDRSQFMDIAFLCHAASGDAFVNDDESTEVGWFSTDDLPPLTRREMDCIADAYADRAEAWFAS